MKPVIRAAILPTSLIVAAIGLWLGVGQPARRDLPAIRRELAERRGQLETNNPNFDKINTTHQLQEKIEAARPTLAASGVAAGNELDVIVTIERLAERRGVTERLNLEDASLTNRDNWNQSKINLEVSGSFTAIIQYLADLRQLPWLITFSTLNLTRDTSPNIRVTLVGRVLWKPQ